MLMYVHRERADGLDIDAILKDFIASLPEEVFISWEAK